MCFDQLAWSALGIFGLTSSKQFTRTSSRVMSDFNNTCAATGTPPDFSNAIIIHALDKAFGSFTIAMLVDASLPPLEEQS